MGSGYNSLHYKVSQNTEAPRFHHSGDGQINKRNIFNSCEYYVERLGWFLLISTFEASLVSTSGSPKGMFM
jgi:hypothetical protein